MSPGAAHGGTPSALPGVDGRTTRALAALAAADRVVLLLVYFHGRTQAEVAAELALPRVEVQRRVARGLLELGHLLLAPDGDRSDASCHRRPG